MILADGNAPIIATFNSLFDWKLTVPDSLVSVSLPSPSMVAVPSPISIIAQVSEVDEIQVMDPLNDVVHSATKSVFQSANG